MLVPASRAFRTPGTDFTVLVSLTVGLLLWLVLACFGLARLQQQATMQLQRAAARVVVAEVAPLVASGTPLPSVLAARPDIQALADSTGLHIAVDTLPTAATTAGMVNPMLASAEPMARAAACSRGRPEVLAST